MTIQPLPPKTASLLSSSQIITDPCSVIKELLENALDAGARAISIDCATNWLDLIQVRDNGCGIGGGRNSGGSGSGDGDGNSGFEKKKGKLVVERVEGEDRRVLARRGWTSKFRSNDLVDDGLGVGLAEGDSDGGGSVATLGFRGEALASIAELSGKLCVTTRVEGEEVGMVMVYGKDGEMVSQRSVPSSVGTTVRVENFLAAIPVRRRLMLKETKKQHAMVKHLLQSYALARPSIRLSLHILNSKARRKNDSYDWIYVAKSDFVDNTVGNAAMQVISRECTSQCIWKIVKLDGYEAHALLPKADAEFKKVMGYGQFLSVDSRPVRANGETIRAIVKFYKEKLRENCHLEEVRDPFLFLNLKCPRGSYDSSVEPRKNDVAFEERSLVIQLTQRLFSDSYTLPARMALATENLSEDEKSIQPYVLKLPQYELGDKPFDEYKTPGRRDPDQSGCDSGLLTPDKSDLNPWVLAKLHSGLGKRKNRADTIAPSPECKQVSEAADGDTGRICGSDMEYHTFLPSPLPSSPLSHQAKSHKQYKNRKFSSPVTSSLVNATSWHDRISHSGIKSNITRHRPAVDKNDLHPFEKSLRHSTFSCGELPKLSISKPFVSPFSSCRLISTPSLKGQGPQINIVNDSNKMLQASAPSAINPAGESSKSLHSDGHDRTEYSPSERELQLDWLKEPMPPLTESTNDGVVQNILCEKQNNLFKVFSSVRTSVIAIQRSLSVFDDIIYDNPTVTGPTLLGSCASRTSWNALTRSDIEKYAETLTSLLSGRGIAVPTSGLIQSIEEAVSND